MAQAAERRATYEDVLRSPAHVVAEVVFGMLYQSPRPAMPHALAAAAMAKSWARPSSVAAEGRAAG
jgi:hypothetical protein